jgi:hypothetical protein
MTVISKKIYIKPGCIRSVQIFPNGVAHWVVKHNNTLINVTGIVEDMQFIANSKFKHVIDEYTPKRINRKKNNVVINGFKQIAGDCIFMGEKRRVMYNSTRVEGTISWKGETIKVKVVNGIARKI